MTFVFWLLLQAHAYDATPARLDAVMAESRRATFQAADGTQLNFTTFGASAATNRPIVISPGKGESAFRYVELVEQLMRNGFGPIYILDHRGQGFSQRLVRRLVHVNRFEDYVTDFLAFVKGPVATDLRARGFDGKPLLIAHSMGGAIANVASLREPGLVEKTAYIAPMMDLNTGPLNVWHDRPAVWAAEVLCRLGFCAKFGFGAEAGRVRVPRYPNVNELEAQHEITAQAVSASWLRANVRATWEIQARAGEHTEPSLVLIASHDKIVENASTKAYACAAKNCELKVVKGRHSLHQGKNATQAALLESLLGFFDKKCADEI